MERRRSAFKWTPYLLQALQRLEQAGDFSRWPQSWRWNWRDKADAEEKLLAWSGASIVCAGVTQGMMVVDTASRRCKIQTQKGLDLVYVEFIENAPWKRAELTGGDPRYRGTGTLLVRAAVARSEELGAATARHRPSPRPARFTKRSGRNRPDPGCGGHRPAPPNGSW